MNVLWNFSVVSFLSLTRSDFYDSKKRQKAKGKSLKKAGSQSQSVMAIVGIITPKTEK